MKRMFVWGLFSLLLITQPQIKVQAQSEELQQLILNIERLNQLRAILNELYKGYQILTTGYNTIKDLSEGNFSLHKTFLDGLLNVSSTVKKYKRIAEIVTIQQQIIKQCNKALPAFKDTHVFSEQEIDYLEKVYEDIFNRSIRNMDELLMIITAGQLRMNDAERLNAIDRIYKEIKDKQEFLRYFNKKTALLGTQRKKANYDYQFFQQLLDLK
jgi:hypothetical protein